MMTRPREPHLNFEFCTRDIPLGWIRDLLDQWRVIDLTYVPQMTTFVIEAETVWCNRYLEDAGL